MQQQSPEPNFTEGEREPTLTREAVARSFGQKLREPEPDAAAVTLADAINSKAETAKPGETPKKPKTLKELAETAKLELKDLYDLELSTEARDGEAVGKSYKLGELKDIVGRVTDFDTREAAFEEKRVKAENELLRARQEVQAIIGTLPRDAIKPELLEKVRAEADRHKAAESERLLEAVPEWNDEERKEADLKGMAEHLAEYGFGESTLKTLVDHRLVKFIRDSWQRWDRMNKALAKVQETKPKPKVEPSRVQAPGNRRQLPPPSRKIDFRQRIKNTF